MEPAPENRPVTSDEVKDVLLKLLRGAHIKTKQKEQAGENISSVDPKFSLLDVIKEEKHGTVYLYEENTRHTLVIIKKRPLSETGIQETKLLVSLKHKNIINIFGVSKTNKHYIIPMEYLSGGSLEDRLVQPFLLEEFLVIAKEICEGLSFAHKNRVVHGNLRPSNILFSGSGEVKVSDFALVEHYLKEKKTHNWYNFTGEDITAQTDIFAAGVIFHRMLTGSLPAWLDTVLVENETFKSLPEALQRILKTMLAHRRNKRYKTFDTVLDKLNKLVDKRGNVIQSKQKAWGNKKILLSSKQNKKRLMFLLFLFLLSIVFAALMVYFLGDDLYVNNFKKLFEKTTYIPIFSKQ
jgi:serine/threonine-protein kinase